MGANEPITRNRTAAFEERLSPAFSTASRTLAMQTMPPPRGGGGTVATVPAVDRYRIALLIGAEHHLATRPTRWKSHAYFCV